MIDHKFLLEIVWKRPVKQEVHIKRVHPMVEGANALSVHNLILHQKALSDTKTEYLHDELLPSFD